MKIGDVITPEELGCRGFDQKELMIALRRLRTVWCWGAHAWTTYKDKWIRFKSEGHLHKGHVYITLAGDDTFTIIYTTVRGKVIDIDTGIYVDMLVGTIDKKIETK